MPSVRCTVKKQTWLSWEALPSYSARSCITGTDASEDYGSCTRGCGEHVEAEELAVLAYVTIEVVAPRQRQTPWTNVAIHWAALASAAFAEPKAF